MTERYIWDAPHKDGLTRRQYVARMYSQNYTCAEIAREFGVTDKAVEHVIARLKPEEKERQPVPVKEPKQLLMERAEKRIESERYRESLIYSLMADVLRESLAAVKGLTVPAPAKVAIDTDDEETACIHISDCQIGQLVSLEHTSGINQYDSNVFVHRARHLAQKVIHITNLHRHHAKIRKLVVFLGGDIVENDTMRGAAKKLTDLEIGLQMMLAYRVLSEMILTWLQHFETVEVETVQGNHGRIGKPGENHPMSNYDHMVYSVMRDMLKAVVPDDSRLKINVPYSTFVLKDVMGYNFLMVHGEEIKSWMGIPFYGANREKDDLEKLMEWIDQSVDYLLIGHHHRFGNWEHSIGEIMLNGSWVGPCNFSINNLRKGARASQNFWYVHPEQGITAKYRLYLDRIDPVEYEEDLLSRYLEPEFAKYLRAS